ncbi:nitroreductase/quinone reductase family protein [Streptomyces sp. NBC_01497]|uniref:nitroreductase/quinone reductase family protein n=1 Tax=Streptomyces sp. NBC_01497 TaxID=2903885 RepID=UPI002E300C72|nr:nitroreductase/quinone reductase family protein [Streptomyces sp. NBC_01497]
MSETEQPNPNDVVIAEFRANKGVVTDAMGGHFRSVHLLLLHHTGRRSGRALINPLVYFTDGDDYVVAGSNGGAEKEPLWVANVEALDETTAEIGERTLRVRPKILREGDERDRLFGRFAAYWPDAHEYVTHTDRPFAMVVLSPVA